MTAGDYSLLLTCEGYPVQAVPATVTEGMTLLEVPLLRSDEFDRGDGTFEVAVQPFERSAFVTWSASEAEAWCVQWRPMDSAFYIGTETVAESQFDIDDLERQKDYVVRIAELSGQAERSYRIAYFTTAAQSGRYAGMALQSEYAVGAPVLLKAINVSDEAQLSWAVDGEATTESVVRLAAGEHEVELRVTDGGRTEIITKYIKVE